MFDETAGVFVKGVFTLGRFGLIKRSSSALLVWIIWISVNAAVKAPEAVLTPLHILTLYELPAIKNTACTHIKLAHLAQNTAVLDVW